MSNSIFLNFRCKGFDVSQIEFCKVDCTKWFQILIYIFKIYELKFRDLKSFIYMVWESLKVEYEVANT